MPTLLIDLIFLQSAPFASRTAMNLQQQNLNYEPLIQIKIQIQILYYKMRSGCRELDNEV